MSSATESAHTVVVFSVNFLAPYVISFKRIYMWSSNVSKRGFACYIHVSLKNRYRKRGFLSEESGYSVPMSPARVRVLDEGVSQKGRRISRFKTRNDSFQFSVQISERIAAF